MIGMLVYSSLIFFSCIGYSLIYRAYLRYQFRLATKTEKKKAPRNFGKTGPPVSINGKNAKKNDKDKKDGKNKDKKDGKDKNKKDSNANDKKDNKKSGDKQSADKQTPGNQSGKQSAKNSAKKSTKKKK